MKFIHNLTIEFDVNLDQWSKEYGLTKTQSQLDAIDYLTDAIKTTIDFNLLPTHRSDKLFTFKFTNDEVYEMKWS